MDYENKHYRSPSFKAYCSGCGKHTRQAHIVNAYGSQCLLCNLITSSLSRNDLEANKVYTPEGLQGQVVYNDKHKVIFSVDKPDSTAYYQYNKDLGIGGITELPKNL